VAPCHVPDLNDAKRAEAVDKDDAHPDFVVWPSGPLAAMQSSTAFKHCIFASIRLRIWYDVDGLQCALQ